MTPKIAPKIRKEQIVAAALVVAARDGVQSVSRSKVAAEMKCAPGLVSYHFGTMKQLHRDVMRKAVQDQNLSIIAQGLALGDRHARKAPDELRERALAAIA